MKRRKLLTAVLGLPLIGGIGYGVARWFGDPAHAGDPSESGGAANGPETVRLSDAEWRERLTPGQYRILRDEGTEPAGSSELLHEDRPGEYRCAGCDLKLFDAAWKYDSRTGWPSFYRVVEAHIGTRTDFRLIYPRTEYHCRRCGGHQGHVFNDGPEPTGQRWCNNGLALRFVPEARA